MAPAEARDASRRRPVPPLRRAADRGCGVLDNPPPARSSSALSEFETQLVEARKANSTAPAPTEAEAAAERIDSHRRAKALAVAALQRLFYEELPLDQDPNAAAARALRRLGEQVLDTDSSSGSKPLRTTKEISPRTDESVWSREAIRAMPLDGGRGAWQQQQHTEQLELGHVNPLPAAPPMIPVAPMVPAPGSRRPNSRVRRQLIAKR